MGLADLEFGNTLSDLLQIRNVIDGVHFLNVFGPDPSWLILVFKLTADFGDRFAEVVG
jgi:hypothetical protein